MGPQDANADADGGAENERLAEFLLRELAPSMADKLQKKYGFAIPEDEIPGVIDEAAARLVDQASADDGALEDRERLVRLFYTICRNVARELVRMPWNRQRKREHAVPSESLDEWANVRPHPTSGAGDRAAEGRKREGKLVHEAMASLSERDQIILAAYGASPDGRLPVAELAAELGVSKRHVYRLKDGLWRD